MAMELQEGNIEKTAFTMGTMCIHSNQEKKIGITKAAASVEKDCIEKKTT
jgi:hypothetical protein